MIRNTSAQYSKPNEFEEPDLTPVPIVNVISAKAQKHPNHIAIVGDDLHYTFQQMEQHSNQIANGLLEISDEHAQPVGMLLGKEANAIISFLGVMKSGKIFIGFDPSSPPQHLKNICADVDLKILITSKEYLPIAKELIGPEGQIILLNDWLPGKPDTPPNVSISMDDTAAIFFTSGSTGRSKGVMLSHLGLWHRSIYYILSLKIPQMSRGGCPLHLSYSWPSHLVLAHLATGSTIYNYDYHQKTALEIAAWLDENKLNMIPMPSALLKQFITTLPEDYPSDFPHLTTLNTGGSEINKEDIRICQKRFSDNINLVYGYASSESGSITRHFYTKTEEIVGDGPPKHGLPIPSVELLILDEQYQPLPQGEHGEITIRSDSNMSGYWKRPDLNKRKFIEDPKYPGKKLLLSGDMGYIDKDGVLVFTGRKDNQVKIRGFLVNIKEVEVALDGIPAILEAAVKSYTRKNGELSLAAYYSLKEGYPFSIQEIKEQLSAKIPPYMIPQYFINLEKLPHGISGKIDPDQLPPPSNKRPELSVPFVQPQTEQEQQIAAIWHNILDIEPIGVDDNFFDLGGDSLSALEMALEIEKTTSRAVPQSYFSTPTIRHLLSMISDEESSPERQEIPTKFYLKGYKTKKKKTRWQIYFEKITAFVKKLFRKRDTMYAFDNQIDNLVTRYIASQPYHKARQWLLKWSQNRFITKLLYSRRKALYRRWLNETHTNVELTDELFQKSLMTNLPYDLWWYRKVRPDPESPKKQREVELMLNSPSKFWASLAEFLYKTPLDELEQHFPIKGLDHVTNIIENGQSVVLLGFHGMTNPIRFLPLQTQIGIDIPTITFRDPLYQADLNKAKINQVTRSTLNAELALYAQKVLQNGGIIHITGDSNDPIGKDYQINVCGRAYNIKTGFAEIAMHANAAVIPYFGRVLSDGRPEMNIFPPFDMSGGIDGLMTQFETFVNYVWINYPEAIRWKKIFNHFLRPPIK